MPYEGLGVRHTAVATKASTHGQIVVEDGFVGTAFKVLQVAWNVLPSAAQNIAIGEQFEIQLAGVHEAPASANLAAAAVGNDVYIRVADNVLGLAAQALTSGNLNSGWLPVGKVDQIDLLRSPNVVRINANAPALAAVKVGTGG